MQHLPALVDHCMLELRVERLTLGASDLEGEIGEVAEAHFFEFVLQDLQFILEE